MYYKRKINKRYLRLQKTTSKPPVKTVATYLGLSLVVASVINFIYSEEKSEKVIKDLIMTSSM